MINSEIKLKTHFYSRGLSFRQNYEVLNSKNILFSFWNDKIWSRQGILVAQDFYPTLCAFDDQRKMAGGVRYGATVGIRIQ